MFFSLYWLNLSISEESERGCWGVCGATDYFCLFSLCNYTFIHISYFASCNWIFLTVVQTGSFCLPAIVSLQDMFGKMMKTQGTCAKEICDWGFTRSRSLIVKVPNFRKHLLLSYQKEKSKYTDETMPYYYSMVTSSEGQLIFAVRCTMIVLGGCLYACNSVGSKEWCFLQKSLSAMSIVPEPQGWLRTINEIKTNKPPRNPDKSEVDSRSFTMTGFTSCKFCKCLGIDLTFFIRTVPLLLMKLLPLVYMHKYLQDMKVMGTACTA